MNSSVSSDGVVDNIVVSTYLSAIESRTCYVMACNLSGFLQLPDGRPAGPPGGLLAPHVLHLAHNHHLHPLRLPCQGRG